MLQTENDYAALWVTLAVRRKRRGDTKIIKSNYLLRLQVHYVHLIKEFKVSGIRRQHRVCKRDSIKIINDISSRLDANVECK